MLKSHDLAPGARQPLGAVPHWGNLAVRPTLSQLQRRVTIYNSFPDITITPAITIVYTVHVSTMPRTLDIAAVFILEKITGANRI